jgi:aspartate 1-decarboxylase
MKTVLKCKVQEIEITNASQEYEGSITLDEDIMDKLGVCEYEQVFVNSKYNEGRIMTYFLKGPRGSGCCELNGGAANHFKIGEKVHLLVFKQIIEDQEPRPIIL